LTKKITCSLPTENVPSNSLSDSTWKCPICGQIVPRGPVSSSHPGWHVSSSVPDSKRCKMCGQIVQ
jgi:hypothetical protein